VERITMSFDQNNPFGIVKDGLIFAAIGKVFQIATDKTTDYLKSMPDEDEDEAWTVEDD
tara:strand:- start:193 stop:369 length:177 start_codon:yes stop_codon:yes gene_type:complete